MDKPRVYYAKLRGGGAISLTFEDLILYNEDDGTISIDFRGVRFTLQEPSWLDANELRTMLGKLTKPKVDLNEFIKQVNLNVDPRY